MIVSTSTMLLQVEPVIQKGHESLVHHLIIYACWGVSDMHIKNTNKTSGICSTPEMPEFSTSCQSLVHAWAIGGGVSRLPSQRYSF